MSKANLFLAASPRSGSTQLAAWLNTHPDISVSSIKEPNFFSNHMFPADYVALTHLNDVDPEHYVRTQSRKPMQFSVFREPEHYSYLFSQMDSQWKMDASTTYLQCPEAPGRIHEYNPNAKIIVLVRDPLERAISHYRLAIRTGRTKLSLAEELRNELDGKTPLPARFLLRYSKYENALAAYHETFANEMLLNVSFERMISDPVSTIKSICEFLDISSSPIDLELNEKNSGDSPRFYSFNIWLQETGLKTYLRRLAPRSMKRMLKPFYFSKSQITIPDDHIALLKSHL